ncbi:MAG: 16S rRNA (cytidine(1402)-2'-O)-methyltransferase [Thermodesulfobacteriota bacterium]
MSIKNLQGKLYLVSTPIGNLEDITLRALRILKEVDLIAAEDTRHTRKLLTHYDIHKPLISYHEHNQQEKEEFLLQEIKKGKSVALVTDAGTPGISDPGVNLVKRFLQESISVIPIPGPSALIAALSLSGLPTDSFIFYGFLPHKESTRQRMFSSLKDRPETLVFFESPQRLKACLQDALQTLGDRQAVVARELTKIFEEVYRGKLSEIISEIEGREVKGEITLVIAGSPAAKQVDETFLTQLIKEYLNIGQLSLKELATLLSAELKVSKRELYKKILEVKKENQ